MPQFEPLYLDLQWNSAAAIIGATIVILACYVLPLISRVIIARSHLSI